MERTAFLSECDTYRYLLTRIWDTSLPIVVFVMLNPSTADGEKDDPTIRRCIGFAQRWGLGGLAVCNLFAYRATKPKDLADAYGAGIDIAGPLNRTWVQALTGQAHMVVAAWGSSGGTKIQKLVKEQAQDYLEGINAVCLGRSRNGQPRHPLMLSYETTVEAWNVLG